MNGFNELLKITAFPYPPKTKIIHARCYAALLAEAVSAHDLLSSWKPAAKFFPRSCALNIQRTSTTVELTSIITEARAYAALKLYIIVLACSPDYYQRVQYALNEELNQWQAGVPEVLLLVPGKAASLYEACEIPLTPSDLETHFYEALKDSRKVAEARAELGFATGA